MAGMEGFEPPNAGTKTRCLTTWRHPNILCVTEQILPHFCSLFNLVSSFDTSFHEYTRWPHRNIYAACLFDPL